MRELIVVRFVSAAGGVLCVGVCVFISFGVGVRHLFRVGLRRGLCRKG